MTCEEFWKRAPDGLEHLTECRACALRHERQALVAAGLRRLGAEAREREAPARVERRLIAAFRGQARLGAMARPVPMWWAAGAWAAALAVTIALAVFLAGGRPPERNPSLPRQATQLAAAQPAADVEAEAELADFIPLPNAERIAPNEAVNLVRLEVPRSTMIALGFEVSAEQAEEPVEADVMLGADGVARAVRFLD